MNKENYKEQINDIMGDSKPVSADVDWRKRCEELEKQLNSTRVEEGRVKKLAEELKARDEELAKLRAKNEEDNLLDNLSQEEREEIPAEFLNATSKLIRSGLDKVRSQYDQRLKDYESRMSSNAQEDMLRRIDAQYPKFRQDVGAGGDKQEAWSVYRRYNQASIAEAINTGDYDTLSYHIKKFYTDHLGVSDPTEGFGAAASEPSHVSAATRGQPTNGNKYTIEELDALYEEVEKARDNNDYAEVRRLSEMIKKAQVGG